MGYLCSFSDLEVKAVFLDEIMQRPENPSQNDVLNLDTKSLRETRDLLEKVELQEATQFIESFESVVCRYAREHRYDGVICGHIHDPKIKSVDGTVYANCGCWTEKDNCSFLYEDENGKLRIGYHSHG